MNSLGGLYDPVNGLTSAWQQDSDYNPTLGAWVVGAVSSARLVKQGVLNDLIKLLAQTTNLQNAAELQNAIQHLKNSLAPSLWVDDNHLNLKHGNTVFNEEQNAVEELNDLLNRGMPVEGFINSLVQADKSLAQTAINDAIAAQGKPKDIAKAQAEMAEAIEEAIEHYRKAWTDVGP